jgi:hypothetical protein
MKEMHTKQKRREMQICIHILSKILQNGSVIEKLWLLQIAIFISFLPLPTRHAHLFSVNDGIVLSYDYYCCCCCEANTRTRFSWQWNDFAISHFVVVLALAVTMEKRKISSVFLLFFPLSIALSYRRSMPSNSKKQIRVTFSISFQFFSLKSFFSQIC